MPTFTQPNGLTITFPDSPPNQEIGELSLQQFLTHTHTGLAGDAPLISGTFSSLKKLGAKGDGVTDDTTIVNNAISSLSSSGGGILFVDNGANFLVSNIIGASNVQLLSYGGKFTFSNTATGNMIVANSISNFKMHGVILDGGYYTTYTPASTVGNRTGFSIDSSSKIELHYCSITGFSSDGLYISNVGYSPIHGNSVVINCCNISRNYQNINLDARAEYIKIVQPDCTEGKIGLRINAGNVSVTGGNVNDNVDNVHLDSGVNDAHGTCVGVHFNHSSQYALVATNIVNGFTFTGCHFYYGSIYLNNCSGIQIINGHLGGNAVYEQGGGYNYIKDNIFNGPVTRTPGYNSTVSKVVYKGNTAINTPDLIGYNTVKYFVESLTGLVPTTVGTTKQAIKFINSTRYVCKSIDTTIYDETTGIGTVASSGLYSFDVSLKVSNTGVDDIIWMYIETSLDNFTTVRNSGGYTVLPTKASNNYIIHSSSVILLDPNTKWRIVTAAMNGNNFTTVASETHIVVQSLD